MVPLTVIILQTGSATRIDSFQEVGSICFWMINKILLDESYRLNDEIKSNDVLFNDGQEFKFSAAGLTYEVELTDIFVGNFDAVPFDRKGIFFNSLFSAYVSYYAEYCPSSLPENKVELKKQECATETVTRNGFGIETNRYCSKWVSVGTGFYASPEMYETLELLNSFQVGNMLSMVGNSNAMGETAKMMGEMKAVHLDMAALIRLNGCDSPGLKRFEENLRLYALGQQPIRIQNLIDRRKNTIFEIAKNQDMAKLMEDLVYENSKQWTFNHYLKGSVAEIKILSRDNNQRPGKVKANYQYNGWNGKTRGSVIVTFSQKGLPDCLYFSDFPNTCRSANRKIVNAYAANAYAGN